MVFVADEIGELRTDESFKNRTDKEYHIRKSPLEDIVNMVTQFPLDRLHLIDLGAIRRIFKFLIEAKVSSIKLKPSIINRLDWLANGLHSYFPSEFKRKPKSISDFRGYKGSEFKRIGHYDGMLLFYYLCLIAPEYKSAKQCFLLLCCALRILSDKKLCLELLEDARAMLDGFVSFSASVFGAHFVVYNIHHLKHVCDDCTLHGNLEEFSAELYESYLGRIKQWLRAPGRTITQVIARTLEHEKNFTIVERYSSNPQKAVLSSPCGSGFSGGLCGEMFKKFVTDDFTIVAFTGINVDNCCITISGDIIIIENIVKVNDDVYFVGRKFVKRTQFFDYPIDSSLLRVQKVENLSKDVDH